MTTYDVESVVPEDCGIEAAGETVTLEVDESEYVLAAARAAGVCVSPPGGRPVGGGPARPGAGHVRRSVRRDVGAIRRTIIRSASWRSCWVSAALYVFLPPRADAARPEIDVPQ